MVEKYIAQSQIESQDWLADMLGYSLRAFENVVVRELASDEIAIWVNRLPVGAETKRKALTQMRAVLGRGVVWGYLPHNPASRERVSVPTAPAPIIRPFESWDEVLTTAAQLGRYAAAAIFACATGLRPQEWIALRWSDLDLEAKTCRVTRTFTKGRVRAAAKTDGSLRTIVLQDLAVSSLSDLPRPLRQDQLVFPAPQGGFIDLHNFGQRVWRKALVQAELAHRPPKECRHTFATLSLAAGADLYWVSRQLGHSNINTTLRYYARFLPPIDERNLGRLNDFAQQALTRVSDLCHIEPDTLVK